MPSFSARAPLHSGDGQIDSYRHCFHRNIVIRTRDGDHLGRFGGSIWQIVANTSTIEASMKLLALLATFVMAASFLARPASAQHDDATHKRLTAYINGFNDLLAQGKMDDWLELWAQQSERIVPHDRQAGLPAIRGAYEGVVAAYTEMRLVEKSRTVKGHEAVAECQFEAVSKSSGVPVSQPVTLTIRFDIFGKITRLQAEYDEEALGKQLRANRA